MKPLLTCAEAADILRIHKHNLYRLSAERKIPSFKVPGLGLRFSEDELFKWLEAGRREMETRPAPRRRK